jgi:hypothetical protein
MLRRLIPWFVVMVMAVTTTWPLVTRLDRSIPQGGESSATVPVFNLCTVGWNLDRVWSGWAHFWDTPHFDPTPKTLALSEPMILSQALAGLRGLPPPVAYNVFLLLAVALNAGTTWWVLSRRRVPWPVALLASFAMARLPFVHWQLGVLQCALIAGLIGTIHFTEESLRTGRPRSVCLAAVCFDLTFLACGYYALFLVLISPLLIVVGLAFRWRDVAALIHRKSPLPAAGAGRDSCCSHRSVRRLVLSGLGGVLVLAAIVPVAWVQSRVLSDPFYERPRELIQELSARPTDYLATPFPEWTQFVGVSRWNEAGRWKLSPGLLKVGLALVGLVVGLRSRSRRAWTLTCLAVSVGAFLGSLGLNFRIAGWCPYSTLMDWLPPLTRLRNPSRMSVLVQIGVVFLCAEALLWGFRHARLVARGTAVRVPKSKLRVTLAYGLVGVLGLSACWEVRLPRLSFVEIPSVASQAPWIDWLKQNSPEDAVIAHMPFPKGSRLKDYESEVWGMYWGLFHHRRMVNGYSGFFPASYLELKTQMQSFPDEASLAELRSRGVKYCVCRQSFLDEHPLPESLSKAMPWEVVQTDRLAGVVILRLAP